MTKRELLDILKDIEDDAEVEFSGDNNYLYDYHSVHPRCVVINLKIEPPKDETDLWVDKILRSRFSE
jgi:hypothetical protein